jgi:signal transduction histidine kinase
VLGAQTLSLVAFSVVLLGSVIAMRQSGQQLELVSTGTVPLARIMARVQSTPIPEFRAERLLQDPRAIALYTDARERGHRRIDEGLTEARELLAGIEAQTAGSLGLSGLHKQLDRVEGSWRRLREIEDEAIAALEDLPPATAEDEEISPERQRFEQLIYAKERNLGYYRADLSQMLTLMVERLDHRLASAVGQADRLHQTGIVWLVALGILATVVTGLSLLWVSRSMAPLSQVLDQVGKIAAGEYQDQRPVAGGGELSELSRELRSTALALAEREDRLRRAERLAGVGKVAAQITHEIRNPLNALAMNVDLLAEDPTSKDAAELWTAVRDEIDRLNNITETYLQLARLPSSEHGPVALTDLLEELITLLGAEIARRGIVVTRKWPPGGLWVKGDAEQLRRALMNLLQNSLSAMETGGRLDLSAGRAGEFVELRITDTGGGIAEADLPRIFDPFFSRRDGGTGLGLAIADRIVSDHNGSLRLESKADRGTTAVLRLAACSEQDGAPASRAPEEPS